MFIVAATVNGKQTPTFFLDANIQGIVDERHAEQIAMDILNPWGDPGLNVHICVVQV
jgi:hypothetical protein